MPHTVDEKAEKRAERLEREAEDAIADGFRLEDGIRLAGEALATRQAFQGEGHRDLIWPLSLWIEALRWRLPAWASGAWRCAGWRLPVLPTNWPARCGS